MTIGEKIKLCRVQKGLSQKELASQIGCDVSFICKVEKNEKNINKQKLSLISEVLNVDFNYLKISFYESKINDLLKNETESFKQDVLFSLYNKK
jgi:transcriptional regulator with XRE-family HTH domain